MSLRPLLRIAAEDERLRALAAATGAAAGGGPAASVRASNAIRPYLLAALLHDPDGLAARPALVVASDDIAARDLARDLGAYLAPRRVHHYPSRGIGYASHLTPAPHLVGLRIAALDALTGWTGEGEPPVVVAGAIALAEAIPDASLRPSGSAIAAGEEVDLDEVAELLDEREGGEQVDLADVLPLDRFGAPLELIAKETAVLLAAADEIPAALRDHWEDVTTAMHDEDARRLYVEVAAPLAERALLEVRAVGEADPQEAAAPGFRAQAPTSAARSISEAQSQLEREIRSGYAVAVAFEHRGEAERASYGLDRVRARFLDGA